MNYLTNYYKNLSEQLQTQVDLLEAGLKAALKSGNKEKMEKELLRQKALEAHKREISEKGYEPGTENFDVLDPNVKEMPKKITARMAAMPSFTQSRQEHRSNIEALAMQLDSEYPLPRGKRRINVAQLPSVSPFGSDIGGPIHVTPTQY